MKRITFSEFCDEMRSYNKKNNVVHQFHGEQRIGYVVFTKDSFAKPYTLKERTYAVASGNKYFIDGMGGNSIFGDCLDGVDRGVRLDLYIRRGDRPWRVAYCYFND